MPSKTQSGVPAIWQLTVSTPNSPFEYFTRSFARPARMSSVRPIASQVSGGLGKTPGARVQLSSSSTLNVPLPMKQPLAAVPGVIDHVPPPVTLGMHRFLTFGKVPEPVIVILAPSWANADACPPPRTHDEIGNMLTMSQRILPSASSAIARDGAPSAPTTPATAATFRARRRVIPCSVMCFSFSALLDVNVHAF